MFCTYAEVLPCFTVCYDEKALAEEEVENVLRRLRNATGAAEIGDVGTAASEVEYLVDDLIGGNSSTLNPFLFRHFWLSVDTRWPAGGEIREFLLVRIINDGAIPLPVMRISTSSAERMDLESIVHRRTCHWSRW